MTKTLRIGISANFLPPDLDRLAYPPKTIIYGEREMYNWVQSGGAIPYMITPPSGNFKMRDMIADFDGIILSGGADVCPKSYGEEPLKPEWNGDYIRDQYEIEIFNTALEMQKPILGVCRGHQLINVALGGTLYQDTATQKEGAEIHRDGKVYDRVFHDINIEPNSILAEIFPEKSQVKINSVHHQAIKDLGKGLSVQARSIPDNIIEAIHLENSKSLVMGVQWHPEWVTDDDVLDSSKVLQYFLGNVD